MSFFTKLMEDVNPKTEAIKQSTSNTFHKVVDSKAGQVATSFTYKGLVNVVAVACVVVNPLVAKFNKWDHTAPVVKK
jgi:hypothetical protein